MDQIAKNLAKTVQIGDIYALKGDLGAGKTHFARAFIRSALNDTTLEVPSPTFTLVQLYESPQYPIWHFDLYRLEHSDEIYELGWEEAISGAVCLVEWPERLDPQMLSSHQGRVFEINIDVEGPNTRNISIKKVK
ncbi:MAG: tRNA (adenosine(37)-N6)-threonylcarbamoyltransferase complex ATPase subunit type 1 TsaE [Alphaproteobacteria bacterium]|nr:tRNA (adenosine(37)-N6)-threonylcarbamoyltransferase complex ATPase subunit type 1 TsaE [Alphaproteobacteria bacterium]